MTRWEPDPELVPLTIGCVECGGTCHLLTTWPADDPPRSGDVLAYRCGDCVDRFDVVIPEPGEFGSPDAGQ